jgi:hypothetical protein
MKKIILISLLCIFQSCSLDFETETRIAVKGKIVDEYNKPISDIEIFIYAEKNGTNGGLGCFDCDSRQIMRGKTNVNGDFILLSPKPTNASEYYILINTEPYNTVSFVNPIYENKTINNLPNESFVNFKLDLGTLTLKFI